ncbi:MAG: hypothetical protein ACPGYV_13800, partial [Phycisphaeraceae bacterium]
NGRDAHPAPADAAFMPYTRNENLTRPWAIPGNPGTEHRVGGLEKQNNSGNVSYDPTNHQTMTRIRAEKVNRVQNMIPDIQVRGDEDADLLVLGWGGPYGSIVTAVNNLREQGKKIATTHLRYLNPMPKNLGDVLKKYNKVLIPELNNGQLRLILRGKYLCDARGLNKIQGKPFLVEEIEQAIELMLSGEWGDAEALYPIDGNVDVNAQSLNV